MAYMTFTDALMNAKRSAKLRGQPFSTRNVMGIRSSYMGLGGGAERASARMSSAQDQRSLAAQKQNFADTLAQQKSQFETQQASWTQQRETALTQERDLQAQWMTQQEALSQRQPYQAPYQAPYQEPEPQAPIPSWGEVRDPTTGRGMPLGASGSQPLEPIASGGAILNPTTGQWDEIPPPEPIASGSAILNPVTGQWVPIDRSKKYPDKPVWMTDYQYEQLLYSSGPD